MRLKRRWTVHVIHHAHTDIGYTDRQEVIGRAHADYIRQAIAISEAAHTGQHPEWESFRWTCETHWGVEQFLLRSTEQEKASLAQAVRRGDIELTGNYLNMTELIDGRPLREALQRAQVFSRSLGATADAAMTADINGYSWGYAQCLHDAGVRRLLSCVHTHHGMYPAARTQTPFWWETQGGERLLVWIGDHYNLGNELGISPEGFLTYTFRDGIPAYGAVKDGWEVSQVRVEAFLRELEDRDYPYDFVPVTVSGLVTDNAPPNPAVIEFIHRWNGRHADQVRLEPSTLREFFASVEQAAAEIPVYRGDWPDWWSDGVASTPLYTQIFREAQRTLETADRLAAAARASAEDEAGSAETAETAETVDRHAETATGQSGGITRRAVQVWRDSAVDDLMLYAEHTWGHHASVDQPWTIGVQGLQARKQAYAVAAHEKAMTVLDDVLEAYGALGLAARRPLFFQAVNPYAQAVSGLAMLPLEAWEASRQGEARVVDAATGQAVVAQRLRCDGRTHLAVPAVLGAGARAAWKVELAQEAEVLRPGAARPTDGKAEAVKRRTITDGVADVAHEEIGEGPFVFTQTSLTSPFVCVTWEVGRGVISMRERAGNRELLVQDGGAGAFAPIYEVTAPRDGQSQVQVRGAMGRNRKGMPCRRTQGELVEVRRGLDGPLTASVELVHEAPGMRQYVVVITVYADFPRVDAAVRMHKESVREPENVYIALPVCAVRGADASVEWTEGPAPAVAQLDHEDRGESAAGEGPRGAPSVWLDKMGGGVRPCIDQLPGTGTDFYCISDGFAVVAPDFGVAVAMPDTPLLQLGPLSYGRRRLHGERRPDAPWTVLYAWAINNFWETNFAPEAGGFYEFTYRVSWGSAFGDHREALSWCRRINRGIPVFRSNPV